MKLFYSYIGRLRAYTENLAALYKHIFKPANKGHRLVMSGRHIFLLFCVESKNFSPNSLKNIRILPIAGFVCFMLFNLSNTQAQSPENREAVNGQITRLQIGDTIPEKLWHLQLPLANYLDGEATITLNAYRNEPFILLEFWSRHCGPCIRALDMFEQLSRSFDRNLPIIPVYVDSPNGLSEYTKDKQWALPTVIDESKLLNDHFFNRKQYGGTVLIVDGIFYASPGSMNLDRHVFTQLLDGVRLKFTPKYPELLHSYKEEGTVR